MKKLFLLPLFLFSFVFASSDTEFYYILYDITREVAISATQDKQINEMLNVNPNKIASILNDNYNYNLDIALSKLNPYEVDFLAVCIIKYYFTSSDISPDMLICLLEVLEEYR